MVIAKNQQKSILTEILRCLQKMKTDFNEALNAGYAINFLMCNIMK